MLNVSEITLLLNLLNGIITFIETVDPNAANNKFLQDVLSVIKTLEKI